MLHILTYILACMSNLKDLLKCRISLSQPLFRFKIQNGILKGFLHSKFMYLV
uniref:Uncharacterized protein n=1 Tax=Arundo donax TaxID=35708 RepID=A0A0A9F8K4_ARUDO